MSDITMEDVTCPHCGAQASFTTYPYVDAAREQELKMRCLNGTSATPCATTTGIST